MTGPINTIQSWGPTEVRLQSQASWSTKVNVNLRTFASSVTSLKCPATVNNPVRPDGSRKMSPWSKEWYRAGDRATSWSIDVKPGHSGWRYNGTNWLMASAATSVETSANPWSLISSLFPFDPLIALTSDAAARTNTLNKVGQKKWDVGVAAVELRQTADLVTDLAHSITGHVQGAIHSRQKVRQQVNAFFSRVRHHGDFTKAAAEVGMRSTSLLEDLRGAWMQYQFGIRPLVRDTYDAANALASIVHQDQIPVTVQARAGASDKTVKRQGPISVQSGCYRAYAVMEHTCETHFNALYTIPTGHVQEITTLGLDNPWSIAWEVTRLSWMVDYVVDVGSWLQSFTAANGLTFTEGCRSQLRRAVCIGLDVEELFGNNQYLAKKWSTRAPFIERGHFTRELLAPSGITPAVVPQIKSTLGLTQLGNSLFALSSVFSGNRGLR